MTIYPAIDLKDGCAVRLTKGEMDSAKIYSQNPSELARAFEQMGAKWLHLVDLNGAFAGNPQNLSQIEAIRASCGLKLQIGGGIRNEESIKRYLNLGVDRVILGTIATKEPQFVKDMASKYRVVVGIDAKDGFVAVDGWAKTSELDACELASMFAQSGVEAIITTDISRDGTLTGVNVPFTAQIAAASGLETIASGGVKDMSDLEAIEADGTIAGVIIGKAYYEGRIDLQAAFKRF